MPDYRSANASLCIPVTFFMSMSLSEKDDLAHRRIQWPMEEINRDELFVGWLYENELCVESPLRNEKWATVVYAYPLFFSSFVIFLAKITCRWERITPMGKGGGRGGGDRKMRVMRKIFCYKEYLFNLESIHKFLSFALLLYICDRNITEIYKYRNSRNSRMPMYFFFVNVCRARRIFDTF